MIKPPSLSTVKVTFEFFLEQKGSAVTLSSHSQDSIGHCSPAVVLVGAPDLQSWIVHCSLGTTYCGLYMQGEQEMALVYYLVIAFK